MSRPWSRSGFQAVQKPRLLAEDGSFANYGKSTTCMLQSILSDVLPGLILIFRTGIFVVVGIRRPLRMNAGSISETTWILPQCRKCI